ncbi:hypothetical protein PARHAE_02038 [Paracoccus haematequi]|uniref:Uncharacterized protein n=1 Tax=Paracoccus haematequi TaxID=2491866 RepID=A0A447IMT8_9RHOB|nr:hypothetical protein [Paracoccus haematequi]VDS08853.1 hypothetical protein PARHAE_02038 [Paracoccus haematequi]
MIFAQINGVMLTAEQPGMQALRPGDPWEIEGIRDLVAAMTGTAGSPVMVDAPSLTPTTVQAGNGVEVFFGTWTGVTPTAVLRFRAAGSTGQGVDVTDQIVDGVYVTTQAGTLTLTVTAAPLAAVSVNATVSAAPAAPDAFADDQWTLQTGTKPGELVLTILALPDDKGSPINALRYRIGSGTWQTLSGTGPGQRVIDGGEAGEDVSVVIVAVNAIGESEPSDPKTAETGAPAPILQATIAPDPLVAGQPASVTFSVPIDGPPTIAQGQTAITATRVGTTNEWTFTPVAAGALIIAATAAEYASSPWTFDVQPALPTLVTRSDNTARIENVNPTTDPFDLEIVTPARYAGERTVTPSEFSDGPVAHVPLTFTGTADVGQALTGDLGLWLTLANDMSLEPVWVRRLTANSGDEFVPISGATGTTYTVGSGDQGYTIRFGGQAEDANGDRLVLSEAQAVIPAAVGWYAPTWKRNGETASRGTITGPDANGDLTIGSDGVAGGNTQGNPRVYFDVVPGDTYELETHIEWGDATRVIGRLSDMTSYNTAIHVSVFDVTKPEGATTLSRTDTFTPAGAHVAMYYIFTMGVSGTAKILSNTRVRQIA